MADIIIQEERSKIERKLKKVEERIEVCEQEIEDLKGELLRPEYASSYSKLGEIQGQIDEKEEELLLIMQEWEEVQSALDEFDAANS